MKKIAILLISAANSYAMEPKIDSSRILCTHESIHLDLLKEHTAQYGLDPEDANEWKEWKQIPKTIRKSLCNYYYDQQYQNYKNGCTKKGWAEGSVSSLLKFIGIPSDDSTEPYDTVPTIKDTRTIMPTICLLKNLISNIPLAIQQTHIKEFLDGTKYMQQYHLSKLLSQPCFKRENKNISVSALTCNDKYIFAGFYDGIITVLRSSQMHSAYNKGIISTYQAHNQPVQALLAIQKYLVSSADVIKIWDQQTGELYYTLQENGLRVDHLCTFDEDHFVSVTKHGTLSVREASTGNRKYTNILPFIDTHALSCTNDYIIVTGSEHLIQKKDTILFIKKKNPTVIDQKYANISDKIIKLIFLDPESFITAGSNEILFFDHRNFPEYQNVIRTSQIKPFNTHPITDLILFNGIGMYSADNEIKTFNKVNKNNKFLTSSVFCASKPTQLAQCQDDFFISGHSNGDIVIWTPENYFDILYETSSMAENALLKLAYQPTANRATL